MFNLKDDTGSMENTIKPCFKFGFDTTGTISDEVRIKLKNDVEKIKKKRQRPELY